jgi:hypothetical protein
MIKVRALQDGREVERAYTGEDGTYSFEVPRKLTTLMFDTHETLTNARDWHPSVVANIDPDAEERHLRCDRILMRVGTATTDEACVDALAGYLFSTLLHARQPDRDYADVAESRLSMMKMPILQLDQIRTRLLDNFHEQTE